jgi:pimeloyl-ACP methyl ester carboxylesterase
VRIVDVGTGPPLVLVPGVQGRWEWMQPAVEALARHCRVITFSLADEPTCEARFDPARGFWCYVDQVAEAMETAGVKTAVLCGVSYGALIAAAFAARYPRQVAGLALVSAIPPSWRPDRRVRFFLRAPWLLSPLFVVSSVRLYPEIAAAVPGMVPALATAGRHAWLVLRHMLSPGRTARRVRMLADVALEPELAGVDVPTLVVTGEASLDRVVPVRLTREYLRMWPHARIATLARSGHLGLVTRPEAFARIVGDFVAAVAAGTRGEALAGDAADARGRRRLG